MITRPYAYSAMMYAFDDITGRSSLPEISSSRRVSPHPPSKLINASRSRSRDEMYLKLRGSKPHYPFLQCNSSRALANNKWSKSSRDIFLTARSFLSRGRIVPKQWTPVTSQCPYKYIHFLNPVQCHCTDSTIPCISTRAVIFISRAKCALVGA